MPKFSQFLRWPTSAKQKSLFESNTFSPKSKRFNSQHCFFPENKKISTSVFVFRNEKVFIQNAKNSLKQRLIQHLAFAGLHNIRIAAIEYINHEMQFGPCSLGFSIRVFAQKRVLFRNKKISIHRRKNRFPINQFCFNATFSNFVFKQKG